MSAAALVVGVGGLYLLARPRRRSRASSTSAAAGGQGWSVKEGVRLGPDAPSFLDAVAAQLNFPIVVTSGTRAPAEQAAAMLTKLERGEDLFALYKDDDLLEEILEVAPDVDQMAEVIQDQVDQGLYISAHLREDALDFRTRDLAAAQVEALKHAIQVLGGEVVKETDHLHMQHLPLV